jgi:hypothetical protein
MIPLHIEIEESSFHCFSTDDLISPQQYNPILSLFKPTTSLSINSNFKLEEKCVVAESERNEAVNPDNIFIKYSPLLDTVQYLSGEYESFKTDIFVLPAPMNPENAIEKVKTVYNASYVDNFFCFINGKLKAKHNWIHGLDYYGSAIGIKPNFVFNVFNDFDMLNCSHFFQKHNIDYVFDEDIQDFMLRNFPFKKKWNLLDADLDSSLVIAENPHDSQKSGPILFSSLPSSNLEIDVVDLQELAVDESTEVMTLQRRSSLLNQQSSDLSESEWSDVASESVANSRRSPSGSSVEEIISEWDSSEYDNSSEESDTEEEDDDVSCPEEDYETCSEEGEGEGEDEEEESDDDEEEEEQQWFIKIKQFPCQKIALEKCEETLDYLYREKLITFELAVSSTFQIIMMLLYYQHHFRFTHNDLHTFNIMYKKTDLDFLVYHYKGETYKVPTYGYLFKMIDFGRSIYIVAGKIFCSDSFSENGDAGSQYNCEPFFNPAKPRLYPNPSFDLSRLACCIHDYVLRDKTLRFDDMDLFQQLIYDWCLDDRGKSILFKKNGHDRHPGFKLYKIIARFVHNHRPELQLNRPIFKDFKVSETNPLPLDARIHEMQIDYHLSIV